VLGVEKDEDMIKLMSGVERGEEYIKATLEKDPAKRQMKRLSKSTSDSVTETLQQ